MNKFDEVYDIRLATTSDIEKIMQFLGKHWKENHILSYDKKLFEYEFVDGEEVYFILAIKKVTGTLEGIFGYLPCSKNKKVVFGSFWKVINAKENLPLLGIELAKRITLLTGCEMHIGNGANPKTTIPLRQLFFKDRVGKMKHYYLLNPKTRSFHIAKNVTDHNFSQHKVGAIQIEECQSIQRVQQITLQLEKYYPQKDYWYINKRFFQHPYYDYHVYILQVDHEVEHAVLVTREVKAEGKKIMRVVDYYGNHSLFAYLGEWFQELMHKKEYEYIDFYVFGFNELYIQEAGFLERTNESSIIIPNYFEPFVQENIDIWVHYKEENTLFFKADGDQDRPNSLKRWENGCLKY